MKCLVMIDLQAMNCDVKRLTVELYTYKLAMYSAFNATRAGSEEGRLFSEAIPRSTSF